MLSALHSQLHLRSALHSLLHLLPALHSQLHLLSARHGFNDPTRTNSSQGQRICSASDYFSTLQLPKAIQLRSKYHSGHTKSWLNKVARSLDAALTLRTAVRRKLYALKVPSLPHKLTVDPAMSHLHCGNQFNETLMHSKNQACHTK